MTLIRGGAAIAPTLDVVAWLRIDRTVLQCSVRMVGARFGFGSDTDDMIINRPIGIFGEARAHGNNAREMQWSHG